MVDSLNGHPATDRETAEALIVEQDRRVVPLTTWLTDAAATASGSNRVLQILTPSDSRITYPLELMLADTGAQWVVRDAGAPNERFRDGLTGVTLRYNGTRFAARPDASAPQVQPARPGSGDLEIRLSTLHQASDTLQVATNAEVAIRMISGAEPTGWGTAEPAAQPWRPTDITKHCRKRVPEPSSVVLVGNETVGRLMLRRVDTGVLEHVSLSGPRADHVSREAILGLAERIAPSVRHMLVSAHPARSDGLRDHGCLPPALPYGLLLGHETIAQSGATPAKNVPANEAQILGTGNNAALWCRLDAGPGQPYELLAAIFRHFGVTDR